MSEKICGVYKIINPIMKVYVGESKDILKRWNDYLKLAHCKSQTKLYESFIEHGVENHTFEILQECSFDDLWQVERYWQDYYKVISFKGLNCKLTKTIEKKQVVSEETKEKLSKFNKGKKLSEEHKNKIAESHKGMTHSYETRKKLSEINKGKKLSSSTKLKFSERMKNNKYNLGRIPSKETIEKRIAGIKKPVAQYDLDGNFIKNWSSMTEARLSLNISSSGLSSCLTGKYKTAGGFKWKYNTII